MRRNLPKGLITSFHDEAQDITNFRIKREEVWDEIISSFQSEKQDEISVKGKVTQIKNYTRNSRLIEIKELLGSERIKVFCHDLKQSCETIEIGSTISVKGYFDFYKNSGMENGVLQIRATDVVDMEIPQNDLTPFYKYIKSHRTKRKVKFLNKKTIRIALVTSKGSAAIKDIIDVLDAFYDVELYPVNLYDTDEIAETLRLLSKSACDVILISRGGLERIEVFNAYKILNEIYKSRKIVITALGHASSGSLSDSVADYSFNTPSAAAYELNQLRSRHKSKTGKLTAMVALMIILTLSIILFFNKNKLF